eukprot:GHRR01031325.1.p1 GENE.GHRR01031325.1~~GHRR01031325.1.p1  ORF type:complete len:175 (+),score=33.41 GHRR01031325.1:197-721(+)
MTILKQAVNTAACFIRGISCFYVLYKYGGFPSQVDGPSMFPTFTGRGDWVVAQALPGLADRIQVGDIVISIRPIQADENIIKRVTAVQGQTVNVFRPGQLPPTQVKVSHWMYVVPSPLPSQAALSISSNNAWTAKMATGCRRTTGTSVALCSKEGPCSSASMLAVESTQCFVSI